MPLLIGCHRLSVSSKTISNHHFKTDLWSDSAIVKLWFGLGTKTTQWKDQTMTTLFTLGYHHCHCYNNNQLVKFWKQSRSWVKETSVECQKETDILLTHPSSQTFTLCRYSDSRTSHYFLFAPDRQDSSFLHQLNIIGYIIGETSWLLPASLCGFWLLPSDNTIGYAGF